MSECGKAVRWETWAQPNGYVYAGAPSTGATYQVAVPCLLEKDHEGKCREARDVLAQLNALDTPELTRGALRMHKL